jgi:hypothetical protein
VEIVESDEQRAPTGCEKSKARICAEKKARIREQRIENARLGSLEITRRADVWRIPWKEYLRVLLAEHPGKGPRWVAVWARTHRPPHLRALELRCILGYLEQIRSEPSYQK